MLIRVGTLFKGDRNNLTLLACLAWVDMPFQSKNCQINQVFGVKIKVISCVTEGQKSEN